MGNCTMCERGQGRTSKTVHNCCFSAYYRKSREYGTKRTVINSMPKAHAPNYKGHFHLGTDEKKSFENFYDALHVTVRCFEGGWLK